MKADADNFEPLLAVSYDDFVAYLPQHTYIFCPTTQMWPARSVDTRLPHNKKDETGKVMKPSDWLDRHAKVEQMSWVPGSEEMLVGWLIGPAGNWIQKEDCTCYNLYRPPTVALGDFTKAGPWLDHVKRVYPDEHDHVLKWLAHRVQHPDYKINHALVLGGNQGIGKDTLLEPVRQAVGPWNFHDITPPTLLGRFNGFVKSVILRVSEAHDLGDVGKGGRYAFYERSKLYTAAPPDTLRVDEKNLREYYVPNVTSVIFTTNHKTDGLYLPPDDRRHFVAWSPRKKEDFDAAYWTKLWDWYADGGFEHVAAWLHQLPLIGFDANAAPRKTAAFFEMVDAGTPSESSEIADVLDHLALVEEGKAWPKALILNRIIAAASAAGASAICEWLKDRKNNRVIAHRMEDNGYLAVRNPGAKDGRFVIGGKRQTIYALSSLTPAERFAAAEKLTKTAGSSA